VTRLSKRLTLQTLYAIATCRLAVVAILLPIVLTGCTLWKSIDTSLPEWFESADLPDTPSIRIAEVLRVTGSDHQGVRYSVWGRTRTEPLSTDDEATAEDVARAPSARTYRWDYPALTALLMDETLAADDFSPFLDDEDPNVATGAAIAIVRLNHQNITAPVVKRLCDTVGNLNLPINLRCAAAEAVACVELPETTGHLRRLVDRYGRFDSTGREHLSYKGEVAIELLTGLAELVDPAADQRLIDALASNDHRIRLVAALAWENTADPSRFPDALERLRYDSSIEVRAAALRALARRSGNATLEYLKRALSDMNIEVRRAAVDGLATLGDIESREILVEQLGRQSETIRVRIVEALARIDARSDLIDAARDRSWRVRRQVAAQLRRYYDRASQIIAIEFLSDPSVEVQRTMLESVRHWPIEVAGHFLLTAMECPTPTTRAAAAEQLADRCSPAEKYPEETTSIERRRLVSELRESFSVKFGPPRLESSAEVVPMQARLSDEELDLLGIEIRDRNVKALELRGERLVEQLEQFSAEIRIPLPDYLFDQVLPRVSPVFEEIEALGRGNDYEKRIAAGKIEQLSSEKPVGRLAMERVCFVATETSDTIVWTRLIEAVADDWSEPAMRLTQLAAGHRSLEVRRRACRKLGGSGDRRYIATLVPALADPSRDVMIEAARSIAQIQESKGPSKPDAEIQQAIGGLKQLLGHGDMSVRLAAADAMNRLGDSQGAAELQRLSYCADAGIRIGVIRAMRTRPRGDFTRTIVRLLDDRATIRRAALEALPTIVAVDPTVAAFVDQVPDDATERSDERREAEKWKAWYSRATALK